MKVFSAIIILLVSALCASAQDSLMDCIANSLGVKPEEVRAESIDLSKDKADPLGVKARWKFVISGLRRSTISVSVASKAKFPLDLLANLPGPHDRAYATYALSGKRQLIRLHPEGNAVSRQTVLIFPTRDGKDFVIVEATESWPTEREDPYPREWVYNDFLFPLQFEELFERWRKEKSEQGAAANP